ncbi:sugar kinase [Cocleimonas sp. KMM 6892]|uniref:sugar kinase n=1 Tax=unclassified Cocleimonas TaxID=2639732 RepID=UPI002DBEB48B|nr:MULTISPECIES: sugar kinase [unclassified Cocleimonas]MEB8431066.1 sugar kinase [Cocleimonas sp. KMM 6892]MEC4714162.1 sugar kinase [Cocleimonas sp. KMM 6895]MEC4743493.1 sugar kinase [Cocleimonas sp. KMM 6896]
METDRKLILVTRHTRLHELKQKYGTLGQAKFYIEHLGESFEQYEVEDGLFHTVHKQVLSFLKASGRVQQLDRSYLPTYKFSRDDIVVVLGQDGLVANTLKYLTGQSVIAINPSPQSFDGVLLPFTAGDLPLVLADVLAKKMNFKTITMAEATTNLGDSLLAVNDLFVGPKSHTSARYDVEWNGKKESHSSSGVIISTGLGSTGWFKSLIAGASGIAGRPVQKKIANGFEWDSEYLYYTVREPFPSQQSQTDLVFGRVDQKKPLVLTSKMAENGVIFSDGLENDYLDFSAGVSATISVSKTQGVLVV